VWQVETTPAFDKAIAKFDKPAQRRVVAYLEGLKNLDDPRSRGKRLTGDLAGYWRYRIGDYRVIAEIVDARLVVIAVAVAHRSDVYD
jgi:mRNA interferase RelE/StbE